MCRGLSTRVEYPIVCVVMEQSEWAEHLVAVVAGEVRRYRKERGLSAQKLADRCGELGYDVPRSVIANLENGRRDSVSLAQLHILAAALEVAPALLVAPLGRDEPVEMLPGVRVAPPDAVRWFQGRGELGDVGRIAEAERELLQMHESHRFAVDDAASKRAEVANLELLVGRATARHGGGELTADQVSEAIRRLTAARARAEATAVSLGRYRAAMQRLGLALPALPEVLGDVDELWLDR